MSDADLERINATLDANTKELARVASSVAEMAIHVDYLRKRVDKTERDEAAEAEKMSARRFALVLSVVGVLLGAGASVATAMLTGGGNASQ